MSVSTSDVAPRTFFKTPTNRIRAVLEVKNGRVKYADGGSNFKERNWGPYQWQELDAFVAAVDAEVEETWDPNYRHPEESQGGAPTDSEA
jgi:hypothetical protein